MDQAALEVQKRIEERIAREGNTDWLRTTIKNFVKTQPGWNSTSENLDNNRPLARMVPFSITTIVVQAMLTQIIVF